jgi:phosphoribosylanthranilate isomerase
VTEVKFCGMTRAQDVASAAALGVHYVGCIFAGGPRHRTLAEATELFAGLSGRSAPRRVGVFAGGHAREVAATAAALSLDVIQLHEDPGSADVGEHRGPGGVAPQVWAVVRCAGGRLPSQIEALWQVADAVLLDTHVPGTLGGTGVALPWDRLAAEVAQLPVWGGCRPRVVLAGGLTPDNVARAILAFRPDVVDVSSGVEQAPGIKDFSRMRAFLDAVRTADRSDQPPSTGHIP